MASIPAVVALDQRYRARGLRVVSTTRVPGDADVAREEHDAVAEAASEEHMTYPCFLDTEGRWARQVALDRTPSFLVVGRDGRVAYHFRGLLEVNSRDFEALARAIDSALAPAASAN